jgi:hypothetical protein
MPRAGVPLTGGARPSGAPPGYVSVDDPRNLQDAHELDVGHAQIFTECACDARPLGMAFALRGAPCGDDQAAPSATRRGSASHRSACGFGSPLLYRAHISRREPADTLVAVPSAIIASSASVRGDRPPSTVAMITGQASRVVSNRASTLFDGINRNWYPTAPSRKNSDFSPGFRGCGLPLAVLQSMPLTSGMKNSSSGSSFVRMSFALRGAPCGDDSRPWAALGRYHDEQVAEGRGSSDQESVLIGAPWVRHPSRETRIGNGLCLLERHSVVAQVGLGLHRIPVVPRHRGTVLTVPYPGLTS